jgi:hypothetical protein
VSLGTVAVEAGLKKAILVDADEVNGQVRLVMRCGADGVRRAREIAGTVMVCVKLNGERNLRAGAEGGDQQRWEAGGADEALTEEVAIPVIVVYPDSGADGKDRDKDAGDVAEPAGKG